MAAVKLTYQTEFYGFTFRRIFQRDASPALDNPDNLNQGNVMHSLFRRVLYLVFFLFMALPLTVTQVSAKDTSKITTQAKKDKAARKTSNSTKKTSLSTSRESDEKQLWLKRARESEIFTGKASWYGRDFHNKKTASGLAYDMYTFTAAHRTLPLGTVVKVTDQHNGKSVMVCITDRGPYVQGRIIDVSYAAAKKLDLEERGVGKVALEVISDERGAPLKAGHAYYIKYNSDNGKKKVGPYNAYADAVAMHEAIRQAHPEAEVVLENSGK